MKNKPKKLYERVYIHAAKVQTTEGWVLMIHAMEAMSEFAFKSVFDKTTEITIEKGAVGCKLNSVQNLSLQHGQRRFRRH